MSKEQQPLTCPSVLSYGFYLIEPGQHFRHLPSHPHSGDEQHCRVNKCKSMPRWEPLGNHQALSATTTLTAISSDPSRSIILCPSSWSEYKPESRRQIKHKISNTEIQRLTVHTLTPISNGIIYRPLSGRIYGYVP